MKNVKAITLGAAIASVLVAGSAVAEVTANIGVTSNYLWRGVSLSGEAAAVSGGVDYSHASGAYVGAWQSSEGASGSGETDLYVGYAGEAGDISYDVGYVAFMYPQTTPSADFAEVYFSVGYDFAEFYYANSSDLELGTGEAILP